MKGRYVGPILRLQGCTALLDYRWTCPESLFAQFDDRDLHISLNRFDWQDAEASDFSGALGFGWHEFPRSHFDVTYDEGDVFQNITMPDPVAPKGAGA